MTETKTRKRGAAGRRNLRELIETCIAIENRKFNPFLLDITEALRILRLHANEWSELEDHLLDMKALASLAKVVGLQSANLHFQSSTLYVDPSIVADKLRGLSREQLSDIFLLSWHPIVELEQITLPTFQDAHAYWQQALPFSERWSRFQPGPLVPPSSTGQDELHELRILADKAFTARLDEFWKELKKMAGADREIDYWSFVNGQNRRETVVRAQLASFLVSYGYATLHREKRGLRLVPRDEPMIRKDATPVSFPISIPH